ncbi:MAG: FISUMP domain-containing protein [Flavobacteriia bacterium]
MNHASQKIKDLMEKLEGQFKYLLIMQHIVLISFSIFFYQISFSQKEPKEKEIEFELSVRDTVFEGSYSGFVDKVNINGKNRKAPQGEGTFKGKYQGLADKDIWLVYSGTWLNGFFDGKGKMFKLKSPKGTEPNWKELELKMQDSIDYPLIFLDEYFNGKFSNNALNGDSCTIICSKFSYYGEAVNWIPNGEGVMNYKEEIVLSTKTYFTQKFKGQLKAGKPSLGVLTLINGDELNGDWSNLVFNGQGTLNFVDTVFLSSLPYRILKFEGSFSNSEFADGSMHLFNGNVLTGNWKEKLFNGIGELKIEDTIVIASSNYPNSTYKGNFIQSQCEIGAMELYTGEKLTGNWTNLKFTGNATMKMAGDIIYSGEWVNGSIQGKGKLSKAGEYEFSGTFLDNKPQGYGELLFTMGEKRTGEWTGTINANQVKLQPTGKIKIISAKGHVREGKLENNLFVGNGSIELQNDRIYRGTMTIESNKIISGEGSLVYSNGDILQVIWDKEGYTGTGRRNFGITEVGDSLYEEGTFRNGVLYGQGKKGFMYQIFPENHGEEYYSTYEGLFKDGKMHGKGILLSQYPFIDQITFDAIWQNNYSISGIIIKIYEPEDGFFEENYDGQISGNEAHGNGKQVARLTIFDESGKEVTTEDVFTGTFVKGSPNGTGKFVYSNGSIYEGEVKDGQPNGKGTMTLKNKTVLSGNFVAGEYQKPFECKTATIGTQIWMAENLTATKFRNGDPIYEARSKEDWIKAGEQEIPAFCYYNNDPSTVKKYGVLYNWYAVNDPRGLAPNGWKIPSSQDVFVLRNFTQKPIYDQQSKIEKMRADGLTESLIDVELKKLEKYFLQATCDLGGVQLYSKNEYFSFERFNINSNEIKYFGKNSYGFNGQNEVKRDTYPGEFNEPSSFHGATYWTSSRCGNTAFTLRMSGMAGAINGHDIRENHQYEPHWLYDDNNCYTGLGYGLPVRCIKN